jgi:threonine dehydrogenase-like Zn-dependent dehydrogenase
MMAHHCKAGSTVLEGIVLICVNEAIAGGRPMISRREFNQRELVANHKLNPARLVTRQVALEDVTDTLQRMTRFDTVGLEVITRFT